MAKHGDDWVPPGYAPVVDIKALPEPDSGEAEEWPKVRCL
jgi:hypothetical protein